MENAAETLVIILSIAFAVFLLVAIIATMKIIQILGHLKRISEAAEKLANSAGNVGEFFKYTAGPAAVGKLLANIVDTVLKHRKKSRGNDK